jgi:hypothetical protein
MKNPLDKSIYGLVHEAGLANNQYQFSALCGRNPTWFATVAARGIPISIEALGTLAANVALSAESEQDAQRRRGLLALHGQLSDEIAARCRVMAIAASSPSGPPPQGKVPEACVR